MHRLHEIREVGGTLDILNNLNLRERDRFGVRERNRGVGCFEYSEFLKGDLDGQREFAGLSLVDLGGGVEDDEEGKEESNEVGVRDYRASSRPA
jgi:hypothetical protein